MSYVYLSDSISVSTFVCDLGSFHFVFFWLDFPRVFRRAGVTGLLTTIFRNFVPRNHQLYFLFSCISFFLWFVFPFFLFFFFFFFLFQNHVCGCGTCGNVGVTLRRWFARASSDFFIETRFSSKCVCLFEIYLFYRIFCSNDVSFKLSFVIGNGILCSSNICLEYDCSNDVSSKDIWSKDASKNSFCSNDVWTTFILWQMFACTIWVLGFFNP